MANVVHGFSNWVWEQDGHEVKFPIEASKRQLSEYVSCPDRGSLIMYGRYYLLAVNRYYGTVIAAYTLAMEIAWVSDKAYRDEGHAIEEAINWIKGEGKE